jgi:hypothetical protein
MRALKTAGAVVVFAVTLVSVPAAWATIWYPSKPDDSNGTGCVANGGAGNSCSLRQAVSAAQNGDTVSLAPPAPAGPYMLSTNILPIGTNITLQGVDARSSEIQQTLAGQGVIQVGMVTATIRDVYITGGTAANGSPGGGISNNGTLTLDSVWLAGNSATASTFTPTFGGGVWNQGTLTIINSTISNNLVKSAVPMSGFHANASGGGVGTSANAPLKISNSTITGNSAVQVSGGDVATGGGLTTTSPITLTNVTLDGNNASTSGGNLNALGSGVTVTVRNSIVGAGTAPSGSNCTVALGAAIGPESYNLEDDSGVQCQFNDSTDQRGANPQLGSLQNNGGPTDTMALPANSPAVDHGNPGGCTDPNGTSISSDQRGHVRGSPCDLGAFEAPSAPVNSSPPAIAGTAAVGGSLSCSPGSWSGSPTFAYQWLRDGSAIPGATSASYTVGSGDVGHSLSCRVTATEADGSAQATSSPASVTAGSGGGGAGGSGGTGGAGGTSLKPGAPKLSHKIDRKHHTAKLTFKDPGATGFQCALVKLKRSKHMKQPKPRYSACRSPKTYKHLARASYEFFVRGTNRAGPSKPSTFKFKI